MYIHVLVITKQKIMNLGGEDACGKVEGEGRGGIT